MKDYDDVYIYFNILRVSLSADLYNLEEEEFQDQKAQKKFRAPGENRTHDPLSSSSDALTTG